MSSPLRCALLFVAVACVGCSRMRSTLLEEIMATAGSFSSNMDDCATFVSNIFENTKMPDESVFCKAKKVLEEITDCPSLQGQIIRLQINLHRLSKADCTLGEQYSTIKLQDFLKDLRKRAAHIFSRYKSK